MLVVCDHSCSTYRVRERCLRAGPVPSPLQHVVTPLHCRGCHRVSCAAYVAPSGRGDPRQRGGGVPHGRVTAGSHTQCRHTLGRVGRRSSRLLPCAARAVRAGAAGGGRHAGGACPRCSLLLQPRYVDGAAWSAPCASPILAGGVLHPM